ncbi:MAG: hypothetical protein MK207_10760 [Saprospiraceae bacterium]|nr:hypothetical protein [Saprospiraceae bacterium]
MPKKTYQTIAIFENEHKIVQDQLPVFLKYQLRTYSKLIAQDSIDDVVNTIENRFGKETNLSNYLIKYLTNNKRSIKEFPKWVEEQLDKTKLSIKIEYYEWLNESFELINSKKLH